MSTVATRAPGSPGPAATTRRPVVLRPPRRSPWGWLRALAITVVSLIFAMPVVWMIAAALKTNVQVTDPSVGLIFSPTLENFRSILADGEILRSMGNSLIVGVASTALSVVIAVPAAWAVGRFSM